MAVEWFSVECKTKTEAITLRLANHNSASYNPINITIAGFGITSDRLRKWHKIFQSLITKRSNENPKQLQNYFRYLIGNRIIDSPLFIFQDLAICQIGSAGPQTIHSPKELEVKGRRFPFSFPASLSALSETTSPHCSTIAAGSQDYVWGVSASLQGQLGPVCVFSEGLQENSISALHAAGKDSIKKNCKRVQAYSVLFKRVGWGGVQQRLRCVCHKLQV